MTETRPPYAINARPRIAYPGSRLELLVEALDNLATLAPEAYPLQIAAVHDGLRATLRGEIKPAQLLAYLMEAA